MASTQFGERLPALPPHLINNEAEARRKLAPLLSSLMMLETRMLAEAGKPSGDSMFKVLAKLFSGAFYDALIAFFRARRACRRHIFAGCRINLEPNRLTNCSF